MNEFDILINGGNGSYAITGMTDRAVLWMNEFVDGSDAGKAYSDDTRMVTEIAEGAMEDDLAVGINGKLYVGGNHCAA